MELRSSNDEVKRRRVSPIRGLGRWKDTMHKGARRHGCLPKGVTLLLKATLPTCAPNRHGMSLLQHAPRPSPAVRRFGFFCSADTRNKRKGDAALQHSEGVYSGLGGRRRHTLQDTLILQARVLTLEGGSSTLVIDDTFSEVRPSLGRRRGPRISTLEDDVIATPGQSLPGTSPGIRPEQAARPVTPGASANHLPRAPARPEASAGQLRSRSR
jgi:hypothetical protein